MCTCGTRARLGARVVVELTTRGAREGWIRVPCVGWRGDVGWRGATTTGARPGLAAIGVAARARRGLLGVIATVVGVRAVGRGVSARAGLLGVIATAVGVRAVGRGVSARAGLLGVVATVVGVRAVGRGVSARAGLLAPAPGPDAATRVGVPATAAPEELGASMSRSPAASTPVGPPPPALGGC